MAKKRPPLLTNKKAAWVNQFKPTATLRGDTLNYNAAQQSEYIKAIQAMVVQMAAQTERAVINLFEKPAAREYYAEDASLVSEAKSMVDRLTATFTDMFNRRAEGIARKMFKGALATSKASLGISLKELSGGMTIKTGLVPDKLEDVLSAAITENVGLIRTISSDYLGQVQGAVMRSLQPGGNGLADLVPFLQERKEITKRHARNIALDQTRKAFNSANELRLKALGVEEFEWIHSGGGAHPRQDHIAMSGNIYRFDDLPVIGVMYGVEVRGLPGGVPGCKCTMRPVIRLIKGEQA